ncbi:signal transduction histidine-protein kinase AtoS [Escherichia albertii B156]|nr:signal transduction histidine-protein kinase AtoS [Escherichia albertii B156]
MDFIMHYLKWIYPRRLRNQMILMAILMVIVPTLTIGYIVETEGRSAVLSEKEKKLSAVVSLLNQAYYGVMTVIVTPLITSQNFLPASTRQHYALAR